MIKNLDGRIAVLDIDNIELYAIIHELVTAQKWAALWKQVAKEWRQAALEAQEAQGSQVPVVGVLSKDTTPDHDRQSHHDYVVACWLAWSAFCLGRSPPDTTAQSHY
jgi:hypothetical protein